MKFALNKIYFAKPLTRKLRFALQEPAKSWKGEINSHKDRVTCKQTIRWPKRQKDRKTERQKDRKTERLKDRKTE